MKVAVLTSGILPVPAVQGGAVENLVDFYLEDNEQKRLHDITVYSVWHPNVEQHPALRSEVNHYKYIKTSGLWVRLKRKLYQLTHGKGYYHHSIEYFLNEALRDIRRQKYDIIVLENRPGYALKLKDATKARLVYHLHNDLLNNETQNCQQIYDAAWRILNVSNYITSRVRTLNVQDTKCKTVLNGIDLKAFAPRTSSSSPRKEFTIVFTGRLIPEKGILPLIQAMRQLKEHTDIRLMVLGSASLGNHTSTSSFLHQLQEAAKGLESIIFTGYVDYVKMGQYLQQADVAALPSTWDEPFGLTCVEALAAGLPLVTTRRGGIPEVVDKSCAVIVDTDEHLTDNLAKAILDLYHHPEKCRKMSEAALKRSQLFSKERYAHNFFTALQ
ncbi:MAG: glycosyltransferase family 4 protein [Prevotella sp.]|nr:glycosyltransferase family 4 protein [Prevotella sp.]